MTTEDNDFYKKEYNRLQNFINKILLKKVQQLYHDRFDFPIPLKHDGSNGSKIMYMLDEIEKKE